MARPMVGPTPCTGSQWFGQRTLIISQALGVRNLGRAYLGPGLQGLSQTELKVLARVKVSCEGSTAQVHATPDWELKV